MVNLTILATVVGRRLVYYTVRLPLSLQHDAIARVYLSKPIGHQTVWAKTHDGRVLLPGRHFEEKSRAISRVDVI